MGANKKVDNYGHDQYENHYAHKAANMLESILIAGGTAAQEQAIQCIMKSNKAWGYTSRADNDRLWETISTKVQGNVPAGKKKIQDPQRGRKKRT